ncbi:unnamed protein product [Xylocopa violacea]|uniref:Uncharacterized protein n=1 Tax=Xylocopa violacea TaxID=135666 RepID=A0ABP1NRY3_XYLVO
MNFLIVVLLTISVSYSKIYYKATATARSSQIVYKSLGKVIARRDEIEAPEKGISWIDPYSSQKLVKLQKLRKSANSNTDLDRKSKIIRSLAILAGLSVGDLTGAAFSDIKAYKVPSLNTNVGASRISPQVAAIYDPYSYTIHPYLFTTSLEFYSLLNPLRLQSISGLRNNWQLLTQNAQTLNLLDNNNDEYTNEAQKSDNVKITSKADERADRSGEE